MAARGRGQIANVGNVWNATPSHTHARRSEVSLYFGLPADAIVLHLTGEPRATATSRWSVHAGGGTRAYSFCWATGGENQDYAAVQIL